MSEIRDSFLKLKAFSRELETKVGGSIDNTGKVEDLKHTLADLNKNMELFKKEVRESNRSPIQLRK